MYKYIRHTITQRDDSKGFTLIELLVVVLIIGILAAVAVPQYQKAVRKTQYAALKPIVSAIVEAERIYYMENGEYTNLFENLAIQVPATSVRELIGTGSGKCVNIQGGYCCLWTVTGNTANCVSTKKRPYMSFGIDFANQQQNCLVYSTDINSMESKICQAETGKTTPDTSGSDFMRWYY